MSEDPQSKAAELVGALLHGGEAIDEGSFTLDPAAAAAKLAQFRYADRTRLLIPIVEGLFGLGATRVEVETAASEYGLRVRAAGIVLPDPGPALAGIHAYAVGRPADPRAHALGRLAIGLDMALAEDLADRAMIAYADAAVELRPGQASRPIPHEPVPTDTLELTLTGPWAWGRARVRAGEHLLPAVRHASVEVVVDARLSSQAPREWFTTVTAEGPGYRVRAGLEQHDDSDGQLELWVAGVCVERRARGGFASRAVVELDQVRRDLGQIEIVDDEVVEQALAAADRARTRALEQLAQADAGWTFEVRPPEWPPERVARALGRLAPTDPRRIARTRLAADRLFLRVTFGQPLTTFTSSMALVAAVSALMFAFDIVWLRSLLGLLAVALTVPAFRATRAAAYARDHGERVQAEIAGIVDLDTNNHQRTTARIWWTFRDREGTLRTGHSFTRPRADAERWEVGEQILVFYDPRDPERSWWQAEIGPR